MCLAKIDIYSLCILTEPRPKLVANNKNNVNTEPRTKLEQSNYTINYCALLCYHRAKSTLPMCIKVILYETFLLRHSFTIVELTKAQSFKLKPEAFK